jgi:hypothetical protein
MVSKRSRRVLAGFLVVLGGVLLFLGPKCGPACWCLRWGCSSNWSASRWNAKPSLHHAQTAKD